MVWYVAVIVETFVCGWVQLERRAGWITAADSPALWPRARAHRTQRARAQAAHRAARGPPAHRAGPVRHRHRRDAADLPVRRGRRLSHEPGRRSARGLAAALAVATSHARARETDSSARCRMAWLGASR